MIGAARTRGAGKANNVRAAVQQTALPNAGLLRAEAHAVDENCIFRGDGERLASGAQLESDVIGTGREQFVGFEFLKAAAADANKRERRQRMFGAIGQAIGKQETAE